MSVAYITVEKNDENGEVTIMVNGKDGGARDIAIHIMEQASIKQKGYLGRTDVPIN